MSSIVPQRDSPLALLPELSDAHELIKASKAPATRRAYAAAWREFTEDFCQQRGVSPLPALPETVAAYATGELKVRSALATSSRPRSRSSWRPFHLRTGRKG